MELDGVGAQDFILSELGAGGADLVEAGFKQGDVIFKIHVGRGDVEAPGVDAVGDVVKAGSDVEGELAESRLKPLGVAIVVTVFDRELESDEGIEEGAAELGEHAEALAPSGAAGGLIAKGFEQFVVAAEHGQGIIAEGGEIGSGRAAEAFDNGFKEGAENKELLGESVAKADAGAVREDERGDGDGDDDAEQDFTDAIDSEAPAGAGLLDEHDDGDGDAGQARAAAQVEQAAGDDGEKQSGDVVPRENAEEREEKSEERADEGSEDAVARGGDGCAEVGLQNDDGADGAPVAVVEAEEACEPPAEGSGEGGFSGVDKQTAALPGEEALVGMGREAELDGKLLLRPRFFGHQAHGFNLKASRLREVRREARV